MQIVTEFVIIDIHIKIVDINDKSMLIYHFYVTGVFRKVNLAN